MLVHQSSLAGFLRSEEVVLIVLPQSAFGGHPNGRVGDFLAGWI